MEVKNLINTFILLISFAFLSCKEEVSSKTENYAVHIKFRIEDQYLKKGLDKFIEVSHLDSSISLIRVYVVEDSLNESYLFLNTYTYNLKRDRKFIGYGNYKGYSIILHSSIDHIIPTMPSLPEELMKFERAEIRMIDYKFYKYVFNTISGTDSLYSIQTNLFFNAYDDPTFSIERAKN